MLREGAAHDIAVSLMTCAVTCSRISNTHVALCVLKLEPMTVMLPLLLVCDVMSTYVRVGWMDVTVTAFVQMSACVSSTESMPLDVMLMRVACVGTAPDTTRDGTTHDMLAGDTFTVTAATPSNAHPSCDNGRKPTPFSVMTRGEHDRHGTAMEEGEREVMTGTASYVYATVGYIHAISSDVLVGSTRTDDTRVMLLVTAGTEHERTLADTYTATTRTSSNTQVM